jgi:hypothetical protein
MDGDAQDWRILDAKLQVTTGFLPSRMARHSRLALRPQPTGSRLSATLRPQPTLSQL